MMEKNLCVVYIPFLFIADAVNAKAPGLLYNQGFVCRTGFQPRLG